MDPRKLSTQELIKLFLATRDEALWAEFMRRFQPVIAGVIVKRHFRRAGRPEPDRVDDLVQETYRKICTDDFGVLRNFEFRNENSLAFPCFLKVMASNVVEDYFRQKNNEKNGGGLVEEDIEVVQMTVAEPSDSSQSIFNRIQIQEIDNCLQQLAAEPNFARDHKIFWLYYRDGLTAQAISQVPDMGLTVKGVESTLLRLIKWLRSKLK
jgi:RNA polymerase sigma-70 factor (ECF subfamily)